GIDAADAVLGGEAEHVFGQAAAADLDGRPGQVGAVVVADGEVRGDCLGLVALGVAQRGGFDVGQDRGVVERDDGEVGGDRIAGVVGRLASVGLEGDGAGGGVRVVARVAVGDRA